MAEHPDPDNVVLSSHERLALRSIEAELSCDRRLARVMRRRPGSRLWLPLSAALLACSSLFLVVMGIRTADPVVVWCFAGLWPFTVLQAFRLLCRPSGGGDRVTSWL
ncbi:DUF3040 domain-containing protein [Streptomyces sp. TLI_185]|uniref:DUF3040 domain-containing protein n=1 Tax=Streptomyces sp. TLI_185 TaxID=2485151 RepID=UPI000FC07915|nr:DUF3040 domain-containing protein [Streptomyces sp. TLI_185]RPF30652.1 DUF3040 family protein [Streptomyces sp. TLI_185]